MAETQEGLVIIDQQHSLLLNLHRPLLTRLRAPLLLQTFPALAMHTIRIHFRAARSSEGYLRISGEKRKLSCPD
jgi:hypothetical protein